MQEFQILKAILVKFTLLKRLVSKTYLQHLSLIDWVKCNTNGATRGCPSPSTSGGIYSDYNVKFLGCFAFNIDG